MWPPLVEMCGPPETGGRSLNIFAAKRHRLREWSERCHLQSISQRPGPGLRVGVDV